jgi:hypothetical protein
MTFNTCPAAVIGRMTVSPMQGERGGGAPGGRRSPYMARSARRPAAGSSGVLPGFRPVRRRYAGLPVRISMMRRQRFGSSVSPCSSPHSQ